MVLLLIYFPILSIFLISFLTKTEMAIIFHHFILYKQIVLQVLLLPLL